MVGWLVGWSVGWLTRWLVHYCNTWFSPTLPRGAPSCLNLSNTPANIKDHRSKRCFCLKQPSRLAARDEVEKGDGEGSELRNLEFGFLEFDVLRSIEIRDTCSWLYWLTTELQGGSLFEVANNAFIFRRLASSSIVSCDQSLS